MPDTAQFILQRLTEWGVKRVYGYPGDGINGLLGAFHEVGDELEFVQTRHEEIASFAACAHAKLTGEVGVWEDALSSDRPVVYEAITDPEVPPLPPHITLEEARNFMRALPHDPDRGAVIKESFKQKIEELIPGR